jgi:putative transcriptional regulator
MKKRRKNTEFFDSLMKGLQEGILWAQGKLELRTTLLKVPEPAPLLTAQDIGKLRRKLKMSQSVFAKVMNVSPKTVQSWEQGERKPSQASSRLLQIMNENPQVVCDAAGMQNGKPRHSQRMSKKQA